MLPPSNPSPPDPHSSPDTPDSVRDTHEPGQRREPLNPWPEEFEDEAPGSYLLELSVGSLVATWSAVHLTAAAALAAAGCWAPVRHDSEWFVVLHALWLATPLSAFLALATILWHASNSYTRRTPRRVAFATLATLLTLALWFGCRWTGARFDLFAPG